MANTSDRLRHKVPDVNAFRSLLNDAVSNARSEFEVQLANDMQDRFDRYGAEMFISDKQLEQIRKIAGEVGA